MSLEKFDELIQKLTTKLEKSYSNIRAPICVEEQVAVTLRFLATGDSFKTIAFSYQFGHSTVQNIVLRTCTAILKVLVDELLPSPSVEQCKVISREVKFSTLHWSD